MTRYSQYNLMSGPQGRQMGLKGGGGRGEDHEMFTPVVKDAMRRSVWCSPQYMYAIMHYL